MIFLHLKKRTLFQTQMMALSHQLAVLAVLAAAVTAVVLADNPIIDNKKAPLGAFFTCCYYQHSYNQT
ncbi:hypothetical protein VCHA38O209_80157 [Vibrio chagasii]|nr:hypothetical protein VCHA38O209_80157 [Vibrio chagasii]